MYTLHIDDHLPSVVAVISLKLYHTFLRNLTYRTHSVLNPLTLSALIYDHACY